MLSNGVPWPASIPYSIIIGLLLWLFIGWQDLEQFARILTMSFMLASDMSILIVGFFANLKASNSPDACLSDHLNILLPCNTDCSFILLSHNWTLLLYWLLLTCAIAIARTVWVYSLHLCNKPPQSPENKEMAKKGWCSWCPCFW